MRWIQTGVAMAVAAALAACGGDGGDGGDAAATPPAASPKNVDFTPYAGNWVVCNSYRADFSARYQLTISQAGENKFHYEQIDTDHDNADCSGPGLLSYHEVGDATATGETVTVSGVEAEKIHTLATRDGKEVQDDGFLALTAQGLRIGNAQDTGPDGKPQFTPEVYTQAARLEVPPAPAPAPVPAPPPPPPGTTPPPPPPPAGDGTIAG